MAEQSLSQLTSIINENGLKYVEHEGQVFFSSEEIGRQLGYAKPSKSINILFSRNQRELNSYAVGIKLMSTDGKFYETRCFTEEGVYILSMLADTPRAREFRAKLARLLREIRERRVELAREAGYRQGVDEGRAAVGPLLAEARGEAARLLWSLGPTQKRQLRRAARYHGMGLSQREISRLLTISRRSVQEMLKAARVLGWLDESAARPPVPAPRQGNLLTDGVASGSELTAKEARHD